MNQDEIDRHNNEAIAQHLAEDQERDDLVECKVCHEKRARPGQDMCTGCGVAALRRFGWLG